MPLTESELESKLRNVKLSVHEALSKKELTSSEYIKTICNLLAKEKVIEGDYWRSDDIIIHVAAALHQKLKLKRYYGFKNEYVCLEEVNLSEEANQDIKRYHEVKEKVRDYLQKK